MLMDAVLALALNDIEDCGSSYAGLEKLDVSRVDDVTVDVVALLLTLLYFLI